jgi:hypothetical protein
MPTKRFLFGSVTWLALVLASPAIASPTEQLHRSSDKEVKAIIDSLAKLERDFEKSLDRSFKNSVLRSSTGEVAISIFLSDFSTMISELHKRITKDYAASSEVKSVLMQASVLNTYMMQNPATKGANEWDAVAAVLNQLAESYFASFPLAEGSVVRRIGDGELEGVAKQYGEYASDFAGILKKEGGKVSELKPAVATALDDLKSIRQFSKDLASRVRSSKPASAEARQLLDANHEVDLIVSDPAMPDTVKQAWTEGAVLRQKIGMAFGAEPPASPTN